MIYYAVVHQESYEPSTWLRVFATETEAKRYKARLVELCEAAPPTPESDDSDEVWDRKDDARRAYIRAHPDLDLLGYWIDTADLAVCPIPFGEPAAVDTPRREQE
jgi:hypothetical protein